MSPLQPRPHVDPNFLAIRSVDTANDYNTKFYAGSPHSDSEDTDSDYEHRSREEPGYTSNNEPSWQRYPREEMPRERRQTHAGVRNEDHTPPANPRPFSESQFRCHRYHVPQSCVGAQIWTDVQIRSADSSEQVDTKGIASWSWPDSAGKHGAGAEPLIYTKFAAAKTWYDTDNSHRLDLTSSDDVTESYSAATKWLHAYRRKPSFDEFQAIAINAPGLNNDWKVVILSLFARIRDSHFTGDECGQSEWLLRADSSALGERDDHDINLTATILSFPYFSIDRDLLPGRGSNSERQSRLHDFEQSVTMIDNETLYEAHIWAILMNDILITYGPATFDDMSGRSIVVLDKFQNSRTGPLIVKVIDIYGCIHILAMHECRTYFELRETLERRCLRPCRLFLEDVEPILHNGSTLTASQWISALNTEMTETVTIILRRKLLTLPTGSFKNPRSTREYQDRPNIHSTNSTSREGFTTREADMLDRDRSRQDNRETNYRPVTAMSDVDEAREAQGSQDSSDSEHGDAFAVIPYVDSMPAKLGHDRGHGSRIGLSMPLALTRTRRARDIEISLRSSGNAEGITCDIPLWLNTGLSRFQFDERHQLQSLLRLEERGLVVFDSAVRRGPSIYQLPQVQRDPDAGNACPQTSTKESPSATHESSHQKSFAAGGSNPNQTNSDHKDDDGTAEYRSINIPRFLDWASSSSQAKAHSNESGVPETRTYPERVLDSMHEILSSPSVPERITRASVYKRAWMTSRNKLFQLRPSFSVIGDGNGSTPAVPTPQNTTRATRSPSSRPETEPSLASDTADLIHRGLEEDCDRGIHDMFRMVSNTMDYFVPLSTDHKVLEKCWGAFGVMIGLIIETIEDDQDTKEDNSSFWIIRDITDRLDALDVPQPEYEWSTCRACPSGTVYRSKEEALDHLRALHYSTSDRRGKQPHHPKEKITPWVRSFRQYCVDQRLDLFLRYLTMSQGYLRSMNALATHIREGVANTHDSKSGKYGLPGSLVKSFEHAVMLVVFASRAFRLVDQYCRDFQDNLQDKSRESRYRLPLEAVRDELDLAGSSAILAIERAEQDILLMARTNYHRGVVRYDDVGPEYVLATVMGNLAGRSLIGNKAVDGVYQMLYDRLYSDVLKHPRAKILRDLFLVREDLRSVGMINKAQRGILRDFQSILEPCTFKATTTTRCSRFTAESHFLENQMRDRSNVAKTLFGLEVRLDDLDTKAWQMLQVNQENHGNAILVFTIVTIIFLPLSWATSYLGMNTSDIRELRQGQGLFWLIGGPLTAVVVIVALLAVLKGEAIREFMIRTESMLESKSQVKKESQNILTANTFMSARKSATLDEKSWVKKRKRRAYPKMK